MRLSSLSTGLYASLTLHALLVAGGSLYLSHVAAPVYVVRPELRTISIQTISGPSRPLGALSGSRATTDTKQAGPKTRLVAPTTASATALTASVSSGQVTGPANGAITRDDIVETSSSHVSSEKMRYFSEFRSLIESKKEFPTAARLRGISGSVVVSVTIRNDGQVTNHRIITPSEHAVLNEASLKLIGQIRQFKAFPTAIQEAEIDLKFPIAYTLN